MSEVHEGTAIFEYSTLPKPSKTWYKVVGDLKASSTGRPLVTWHGGPGACHNYLLPLSRLASQYGITIVFYDQIGNGNSTHFREKRLDTSFWTLDLFIAEWENLRRHLGIEEYDLLGQSWGGMLGADFATRQPTGLKRLIISNSPASMELWVKAAKEWRAGLPQSVDETIEKYERLADFDNQDYKDAVLFYYQRHLCLTKGDGGAPFPKDVMDSLNHLETDDTVYFTMNGPSEFTVIGSLKSWSVIGRMDQIINSTLIVNGEFDEAKNICVVPFFDEIPRAKWKTLAGTSHMSHVEKPNEYCQLIAEFLKG